MPATYDPIATQTLSSTASSVTFSSIPSTYTDLVIVVNASGTASAILALQFNSDTASNYSDTIMTGFSGSALSGRDVSGSFIFLNWTGASLNGLLTTAIISVQNYSNTTTNKTILSRFNSASSEVTASVGLWRNTAAINTIKVLTSVNSFASGSTFTLYGIKAA